MIVDMFVVWYGGGDDANDGDDDTDGDDEDFDDVNDIGQDLSINNALLLYENGERGRDRKWL